MHLSPDVIQKISKLSRIHLEESEYGVVKKQLEGIFDWIDQLQQVNTDGIAPYRDLFEVSTHERDDVIGEHNQETCILGNAPDQAHTMFAVPKVVE